MPADLRRGGSSCLFILQAAIDRWHRVIITRAARSLRKQNFGVNEPFGYIVVKGRVALGVIFVPGGNTLEIDVLISGECIEREHRYSWVGAWETSLWWVGGGEGGMGLYLERLGTSENGVQVAPNDIHVDFPCFNVKVR